jgi:hypothetical protein
MVLFPRGLKVSRSLPKTLKHKDYQVRADTAFLDVGEACARTSGCRVISIRDGWRALPERFHQRRHPRTASIEAASASVRPRSPKSAKIGRTFRRFHAHGLIANILRTRRWRVTVYGFFQQPTFTHWVARYAPDCTP